MKRIALVFEFGTLSGGERSMLAIVDRLHQQPFQFAAIAPDQGPLTRALRQRHLVHIPFNCHSQRGRCDAREQAREHLIRIAHDHQFDLIHANSLSMGRLTGSFADRVRCPRLSHLRDIVKLSHQAVEDLNGNDGLIAVSHATREFHLQQGMKPQKLRVAYNGVDCERFYPRDSEGWLKDELGLSDSAVLIGTIGQICLRKGQNVLAEAAPAIVHQIPNAHFLLIGERYSQKAESVAFERHIRDQFDRAGLTERLHCLGYRNDVPRLMNELNLLIHSAKQEPLGRVLLEAAASGLPIVATAVGGTSEILDHDRSALLVPANDPDPLARAAIELLTDPQRQIRLRAAARQRICRCFEISHAARRLQDIWQSWL